MVIEWDVSLIYDSQVDFYKDKKTDRQNQIEKEFRTMYKRFYWVSWLK